MKPSSYSSTPLPWRLVLFQFALSIPVLLTIPVVAAGITALIASPLAWITPASPHWRFVIWASAAPLIYSLWLLLFLILCALDVQSRRWYRGLRKVPRVSSAEGITKFYPTISLYLRARFVYSLPMVESFLWVPGLRWLVLWSYSTSVHLGVESYILGRLWDPDLTEIGESAIIGTGVSIVAHSLITNPDGTRLLVTAPIVIGPRAVISGDSLIALGVRVGADSIVEANSHVVAYTQIPPGEVWGGIPAVFRRRRLESDPPALASEYVPTPPAETQSLLERDVCRAVASGLNLAVSDVSPTFSADDCRDWDSLGQMAIASALYSLTGIEIPMEQCFRLRSVPRMVAFLASRQTTQPQKKLRVADESIPADPELLPLLNHLRATQLLALRESEAIPQDSFPTVRVVVAATFSAEPLLSSLTLWSNGFGIPVTFESAGFDQIPQALLSPESPFRRNIGGVNLVLTRPEDLAGGDEDRSEHLLSAIAQFANEFPNLLVVANLPPVVSPEFRGKRQPIADLRRRWEKGLSEIKVIQILDFSGIVEQIGTTAAANADGDRIARVAYSADVYAELGIAVARCVRCRRIAPAKVLALDGDGVLWGNVLGEDSFDGISLGSDDAGRYFRSFQQSVLRLKERGVLLVIVSRNELADVQRVFESHPGMILRSGDIAAWRVNWQPKSQNLKEIAHELNVGLDSFVFMDDDPVNQLEVRTHLPEVTVLPLTRDAAEYGPALERLWCFDATHATEADEQRTTMIHEEQKRQKLRDDSINLESYLASLELQVVMRTAFAEDMPRVAQLTQKTNQFNLSLKRRSEAELWSLSSRHSVYVIDVNDRFGHYGLVGVCILSQPAGCPDSIELETLLISCRALGRGVEEATLFGILECVRSSGRRFLEAELVIGPRNQPIADFLRRSGFECSEPNRFRISADSACALPRHILWTGPLPSDRSQSQQPLLR